MRGSTVSGALRLVAGSGLVALFAVGLVRGPASGASAAASSESAVRALVLPSPLPSIDIPLPSLPLPSIGPGSLLPSASLPVPSLPLPSIPIPSLSPLPSVPLPSTGTPPPGSSAPKVTPTSGQTGAAIPSAGSRSGEPTASVSPTPGNALMRSAPDGGAVIDRMAPSTVGLGGSVKDPVPQASSWLVPSLAFGVPALLVVAAVLAQLVSGAAVLGVARRTLSRFPGPMPHWIRGASDAAAQDAADGS